ncbi:MAG: biosynthetic-type acetolactate synthase large subunit [Bacillota bacterium]
MLLSGGEVVVQALKKEGVDTVFGYPGGVALPLYDCLYDSGIRHILTRHEQGAIHAADGYARLSGKVGVCIATSGPGATNLVTGIATAHMDSVPLVCITCQVALSLLGKDSFQEADISGIATPITKHNFMVRDYKMLPEALAKAFYIARTGRPGPVLIDIPKDVLTQKMPFNYPKNLKLKGYRPILQGDEKAVSAVVDALAAAKKPLLIIGGGCVSADVSSYVEELVNKTGIPFVSTLMGLSAIDKDHPLNLGMIGMHGTYAANIAACHCDLLIGLGARFDDRVTGAVSQFAPLAKIAHFDVDPSEINKIVKVDFSVLGDLRWSVPYFASMVDKMTDISPWQAEIKELKENYPLKYDDNATFMKPQAVIELMNDYLTDDAVIVTDVGQHQMWAAQYAHVTGPRRFLSSGGLGTMGYGLPSAIGASIVCPNQDIWLITGDGSIMMNCQEIATAVEENCRIKVLILNNRGLGMVRQWQRLFYDNRYSGSRHEKPTDFAKLAEALGAKGLNVLKREELPPAMAVAAESTGPVFLNIRVDDDENVMPMVAPNSALHQMLY